MGRPFAAALKISPEFKLEFDFGNSDADSDAAEIDFSGLTPLGPCPKCGARVYEQPMAYVCEKAVGAARSCDFRSGRVILQQPIEAEQMRKLLHDGRTDLLRGFVSNRTRRKFAAFLMRKPDGTTGFEFEPRPARVSAARVTAEAAATRPPAKTPAARPAKAAARASAAPRPGSKSAKQAAKAAKRSPAPKSSKPAERAAAAKHLPAVKRPAAAERPAARKTPVRAAKSAKTTRTRRSDRRTDSK
jgi:DNA topoisomerase-3